MITLLLLLSQAPAFAGEPPASAPASRMVAPAEAAVTASVVVKVHNRDAAADALIAEASRLGGWFSSFSAQQVVFRVPSAEVSALLAAAEAQGKVIDRSFASNDLGSDLEDKRSRLTAREKTLASYYALLKTASAKSVLTVEREVVQLVSEIEGLKGSIRSLEHQARYAAVTVSFEFRDRGAPKRDGSSSFAWINSLNLVDLVADFRRALPEGPRPRSPDWAPKGFAAFHGQEVRRAVSPDGVLYRVRSVKHKPEADLAYWKEALSKRMGEAGYTAVASQDLQADGRSGFLLDLAAPLGAEDDSYLVAVFLDGKKLWLVEAAGEVSLVAARREALLGAMAALKR